MSYHKALDTRQDELLRRLMRGPCLADELKIIGIRGYPITISDYRCGMNEALKEAGWKVMARWVQATHFHIRRQRLYWLERI